MNPRRIRSIGGRTKLVALAALGLAWTVAIGGAPSRISPEAATTCWRRSKSEPRCRPNIEPGAQAGFGIPGCG